MKKKLFAVMLGILIVLVGCSESEIETNMSETVPDFEYINQDNETVGLADLEGKWWIADFIFTNCTSVCIPMTNNMVYLQQQLKDEGLNDVMLVSFSVDPDYDTPEVLKSYAESYGADVTNWHFLTGYDFETIKEFSIKNFRNLVKEPMPGDDQVQHGTRFFLVNPEGKVIKNYGGLNRDELDLIVEDLKIVY